MKSGFYKIIWLYYKRNETNDPYSFDTESIKFEIDKPGTYGGGGITYTTTWEFIDSAKTKVEFIINYLPLLTVDRKNIIYTESSLN